MVGTPFFIEQLNKSHDKSLFDCGEPSLDNYLQRYASQNVKNDSARVYVAVQPEIARICGYFTLSASCVEVTNFAQRESRGWPRDVPTIHLGRIAVDREFQGQGLGEVLMGAAIETSIEVAEKIGVATIELWAFSEDLLRFYSRFSFYALQDDPKHLVVSLRTLRQLFS